MHLQGEFVSQFERQWRDYLTQLVKPGEHDTIGRQMTEEEVAALSDEQKVQLVRGSPMARPHAALQHAPALLALMPG